jgi:hypothetical protein
MSLRSEPTYAVAVDINETTASFNLVSGTYGVLVHTAEWNGATVALSALSADNRTFVPVMWPLREDGYVVVDLPAGPYQITVSGSPTNVNVSVSPVRLARA